ncbi:putative gustatory receptor 28a [Anoplolepis gracilipes]|uniref:putative gustatory receptor 28a n=1 Tax=Anoplolepis gracilipes TaxID=354296 RepID=UPI003BA2134D
MFQPKTMHETIMPLLVVNFILGIGNWTSSKLGKILNMAYSLVCLVMYCVLIKFTKEYLCTYYSTIANEFGLWTFKAMFYSNICSALFLVINSWLNRKHMEVAMMRIMMCEKTMEQMGLEKKYRKLYLNQLYELGFVMLMFIVFIIINHNGQFETDTPLYIKIIFVFTINYPMILLYVSDISFLHWVRYAKLRFEQLNSLLQRMLTTTLDWPQHKRLLKMLDEWNETFTSGTQQDHRFEDNINTIKAVKQVHLELIKATRNMNEAYGMQILSSMTMSFVFITCLLNYAYKIFWTSDDLTNRDNTEMMSTIGWILFYVSKVFIINHMCTLTSIEAANTGDIICELHEPSISKEFRAEIRDFTLQLIQNPLIFTACGFFTLEDSFIHGVIGTVATYLVILIQVGDLQDKVAEPKMKETYNTSEA